MIYLQLEGRIGNQLFMYAAARCLQEKTKQELIIDDTLVKKLDWENSLKHYPLKDVTYISNRSYLKKREFIFARCFLFFHLHFWARFNNFRMRYNAEKKLQGLLNRHNLIKCTDGYIPMPTSIENNVVMNGFFQSTKYFLDIESEIKTLFKLNSELEKANYPHLEEIRKRNSVCISVKVQHNVGSSIYDVCSKEYWEEAIKYVTENVENPLFFVCSDNVDYVIHNLIDTEKYDVVFQAKDYPVHLSLAAMAECKHFIIGNTSFGWWAQYLGDYSDKIVIAPSKWYAKDVPCDLMDENWIKIDV